MSTLPANQTSFAKNVQQIEKCIEEADPELKIELSKLTDKAIDDFKQFLRILTDLRPKTAVVICQDLGFTTILDRLKEACEGNEAITLHGVGPKTVDSILSAIESPPLTLEDRMDNAFKSGIKPNIFQNAVNPTAAELDEYDRLFDLKYKLVSSNDGIRIAKR